MNGGLDTYLAARFSFQGRASRKEFWVHGYVGFALIMLAVAAAFGLLNLGKRMILSDAPMHLQMPLQASLEAALLCLLGVCGALFIWFSAALTFRRMHDLDRSGFQDVLGLFRYQLLFTPGTQGPNRFGPDPLSKDGSVP